MNEGFFEVRCLELLRGTSERDEKAFRQLYDLTHKRVYFYLCRLIQDKHFAEDILVETYTEVWKGARKFKGKSQVTTWIMGISRNLAMNELRKAKKHDDINDFPNLSDETIPNAEGFDRQRILQEAMIKLSMKHREILDLVFFHEMTYHEVSKALEIPINTVKTRVFYAKEALKEILSQIGVHKDDVSY